MALSIIEFIVYGLITYSSMLMLIISTLQGDQKRSKSLTTVRSIYYIPAIIFAGILAGSGVDIVTLDSTNTIFNLNTTDSWTEDINNKIVLQNPVWITSHYMLMIIFIIYVIFNILKLFTTHERQGVTEDA